MPVTHAAIIVPWTRVATAMNMRLKQRHGQADVAAGSVKNGMPELEYTGGMPHLADDVHVQLGQRGHTVEAHFEGCKLRLLHLLLLLHPLPCHLLLT